MLLGTDHKIWIAIWVSAATKIAVTEITGRPTALSDTDAIDIELELAGCAVASSSDMMPDAICHITPSADCCPAALRLDSKRKPAAVATE